jgi:hypothetical protein
MKLREFAAKVTEFAGTRMPGREHVAEYLQKRHLGFAAERQEVEAAWSLVVGLNNMSEGQPEITRIDSVRMLFDAAVSELAPRIEQHSWSVQRCRKRILVTTDRPVTN